MEDETRSASTRREGQQHPRLARLHAQVDGERYTGRVVMAPRAVDELTERAKHPQPPPLTAESIRTLLAAEHEGS